MPWSAQPTRSRAARTRAGESPVPAGSDPVCLSVDPGSHQRDGCLIMGLGRKVRPTARQVEHPQARTAVGASPRRQAALIGQELDRADMLGRIAVPPVALMVAVDRMPAGAVDRWARGHRHLTSGRQPGAGTGVASLTRGSRDCIPRGGIGRPQPSADRPPAGAVDSRRSTLWCCLRYRNRRIGPVESG